MGLNIHLEPYCGPWFSSLGVVEKVEMEKFIPPWGGTNPLQYINVEYMLDILVEFLGVSQCDCVVIFV